MCRSRFFPDLAIPKVSNYKGTGNIGPTMLQSF